MTTGSIPESVREYAAQLEWRVRWAIVYNNGLPNIPTSNEWLAVRMVADSSQLDQGQQDRALSQIANNIGGTLDEARDLIAYVRSRPLRQEAADPPRMVTVPDDIRVHIDDPQAARDITPDGMRKTLTAMGWQYSGAPDLRERHGFGDDARESGPIAERWERDNHTVALPLCAGASHDPHRMVLNLIWRVAEVDGVSELAVWDKLRQESRADDPHADATLGSMRRSRASSDENDVEKKAVEPDPRPAPPPAAHRDTRQPARPGHHRHPPSNGTGRG